MRGLPGPAPHRRGTGGRGPSGNLGGGGEGYVPPPSGLWVFPVGLVVILLAGSWLCDFVTRWWCHAEGCTPTDYFPMVAWSVAGISVTLLVAVVVIIRRWDTPGARPAWFAVLFLIAFEAAAARWVHRHLERPVRVQVGGATVRVEALDPDRAAVTAARDDPIDLRVLVGEAWEEAPQTGRSPSRRNRRDT